MLFNTIFKKSCQICCRNYSSSASKRLIVPDENVLRDISNNVYKPKKHPGRMENKIVEMPDTFVKAALNALEDYPVKAVLEASNKLTRHLKGRVPPMEKEEIKETVETVRQKVIKKYKDVVIKTEEDERRHLQIINNKVDNILREKIYNWEPIKYDVMKSLVYLLARSAPEYAVLVQIFGEIANRDPSFVPRGLFDFGSGVGTATWAANVYWKKHIFEYFNVDVSSDMNDLAQILLQGGRGTGLPIVKGTFYRQFLPASNAEYDLVVSAYSMLELPSLETRLEAVVNLWNKTQNYLVIVEQGTNAGFKVINEIRDFILQIDNKANVGHVFSPCPHDSVCPRFLANDGTPCNFEARYASLPIGQKSEYFKELYSYVVLKRGTRQDGTQWPRIVRPTLVRSRHTICRLCTASGKLDEAIFTAKKHGKAVYHCARSSKWGDLLPITLTENNTENSEPNSDENQSTH